VIFFMMLMVDLITIFLSTWFLVLLVFAIILHGLFEIHGNAFCKLHQKGIDTFPNFHYFLFTFSTSVLSFLLNFATTEATYDSRIHEHQG